MSQSDKSGKDEQQSSSQSSQTRTISEYSMSLQFQSTVDKWIDDNPVKYRQAQAYGDFLVSHPQFSNVNSIDIIQRDIIGDELLYNETINRMKYYGIEFIEELTSYELDILKIKLGPTYRDKIVDMLANDE